MFDAVKEFVSQNTFFISLGVVIVALKIFSWVGHRYWVALNHIADNKDRFVTDKQLVECKETAMNDFIKVVREIKDEIVDRIEKLEAKHEKKLDDLQSKIYETRK